MIVNYLLTYVTVGAIFSLVIWFASFDKDFDEYFEKNYEGDPPTALEKWHTVFSALVLWPYFLWKAFR